MSTQTYTAVIVPAEEGGFFAYVEEVPGALTQGETLEETRENLKEALSLILECYRDDRKQYALSNPIVEPISITA
jgi:predicted RNase H-like HicB family nuclease